MLARSLVLNNFISFLFKKTFQNTATILFFGYLATTMCLYEKINNESGGRAHLCFFCRRAFHSLLRLNESLKRTKGTQCLKIIEKVAFYIASEASYVYILKIQKFINKCQKLQFWFFRLMENFKCDILRNFRTLCTLLIREGGGEKADFCPWFSLL